MYSFHSTYSRTHQLLYSTIVLLCISCSYNSAIGQNVLSPRVANYAMDVTLDVNKKLLEGRTQLIWQNPSDDTIDHLQFHLYYNAFKNTKSTFLKERDFNSFLSLEEDDECRWGWSKMTAITDEAGNSLLDNSHYIQPDDANPEDRTVLKVPLVKTAGPKEKIIINFSWTAKIPKTMARTGYNKEFYFLAQWFPKVGVYEPAGMRYQKEGAWNCHQYHSSGEYYSDFGLYDVRITVPDNYVVAASGQLKGQEKKGENKTWQFIAEDVIDFTWSTSPHYEIVEDQYKDTEIKVYAYPDKKHFATRYLNTIKYCMAYLEEYLGVYPYSTLSIVDPPIHGLFTGGMEYPTLITALSFNSFPAGFKTPETLVVHEFIHQYFMQMVATHEVEEPWMDEGFTTYYESRILDSYMSDSTSTIEVLGFNAGNKEWNRAEFFGSATNQAHPNSVKSWEFTEGGYGPISYNKTALWLQTLEGLIGTATMDEIMKTYFQTWKFNHPCREDFIAIVNELVIKNQADKYPDGMDWYFEQVLFGTDLCDYAVTSLESRTKAAHRGYITSEEHCEIADAAEDFIINEVKVCREEGMYLPVELQLTYEDNTTETQYWDGKDNCKTFTIVGPQKVIAAEIDPDRKIFLDKNFLNNSMLLEKKSGGIRALFGRLITSAQHSLELLSVLI